MPMLPRLPLLAFVLLVLAAPIAPAAVVFEFSLKQSAPFETGGPWGVAVDELGDIYVTDTGAHRIVKFDSAGNPIKAWGSEGSLPGQLYYPLGVATSSGPTPGNIRVYVADDGNHRIVTYDAEGQFLSAFGSEGSGNNQLNHPRGVTILPAIQGGPQEICVADTGNDRVSCFNPQGQWLRSMNCADCPGGRFVDPQGVYARRLDGGAIRYYVTDNYPARVVVLGGSGRHILTMGAPGQSGALGFPDDLAVDKDDGSIYVADSGIGYERITKFNADGVWQFNFGQWRNEHLIQPHAIAIDKDGDLVVGHFAEPPVHKFNVTQPRIKAVPDSGLPTWFEDGAAYLRVWYNGVEQVCDTRVSLALTAESKSWIIRTAIDGVVVSNVPKTIALPLSVTQAAKLKAAHEANLRVKAVAEASAACRSDGTQFTSKTKSFFD